jgi:hypothetical protein
MNFKKTQEVMEKLLENTGIKFTKTHDQTLVDMNAHLVLA